MRFILKYDVIVGLFFNLLIGSGGRMEDYALCRKKTGNILEDC